VKDTQGGVADRGGNLVVGCAALVGLGLPVWLLIFVLFQSVYVQAMAGAVLPALRGVKDGEAVAREMVWQLNTSPVTVLYSLLFATGVTVPLVVVGGLAVWATGLAGQLSANLFDRAARRRYAGLVGEVVLEPDAYPPASRDPAEPPPQRFEGPADPIPPSPGAPTGSE